MRGRAGAQKLLIFGLGYTGRAIAKAAVAAGYHVTATSRAPAASPEPGLALIPFTEAAPAIAAATHIISTAAPDESGDPILACYAAAIAAGGVKYLGYLSTTGVYGNRDGAWVDEDTPPHPSSARAQWRLAAEAVWRRLGLTLDIFRLAGIYGPGRSAFDDLRQNSARRIVKPDHLFGRIHRDDIAAGILAALNHPPAPGAPRILNFTDDEPAASATVLEHAAALLGIAPPAPTLFETAVKTMSPMARSFWAENRRVANAKTKAALNIAWRYPTFREGLRAIMAEELSNKILIPVQNKTR